MQDLTNTSDCSILRVVGIACVQPQGLELPALQQSGVLVRAVKFLQENWCSGGNEGSVGYGFCTCVTLKDEPPYICIYLSIAVKTIFRVQSFIEINEWPSEALI